MHQKHHQSWVEPFKIKVVEPLRKTNRGERERVLKEARYNLFLLRSEDVYIDLLSDSGTNASTQAALTCGDEECLRYLENKIRTLTGFSHVIPFAEDARPEEWMAAVQNEMVVLSSTTLLADYAFDAEALEPFKGNVDLAKLEALFQKSGVEEQKRKQLLLLISATVDVAGGQPISLANLKAVREWCQKNGVFLFLDASRAIENAHFIRTQEAGYRDWSISKVFSAMCALADGCVVSAERDLCLKGGGFVALQEHLVQKFPRDLTLVPESLTGTRSHSFLRSLADAFGESFAEGNAEEGVRARVGQIEYVGWALRELEIPVVLPLGGHAVCLDAQRFLPHLKSTDLPAHALAAELYLDSGIRAGIWTGLETCSWVQLSFPRRVYTQAHCDAVIEAIEHLHHHRNEIKGIQPV